MKKKLLVLLGAGSSVEQGLPGVSDLDREIAGWAMTRANERRYQDLYGLLWCNRASYASDMTGAAKALQEWRTAPNFERVLGDLHLLMNAAYNRPFGDPLLQWFDKKGMGIEPTAEGNKLVIQIEAQLSSLLDRLANRIRGGCRVFEFELTNGMGTAKFDPYRRLFRGLSEAFEVGVYNLNYDTVALNALPHAFVGFDRNGGEFLPAEVLGRREWGFLYHMHGSVHHRIRHMARIVEDKDFGPKVTWFDDFSQRGETEDWQNIGFVTTKTDQRRLIFSSLVAGGWKLDQLQSEPFLALYSSLQRHVYEADAILVGGYGFGDAHVDSVLSSMLRSRAVRGNRPPVLVLDYDGQHRTLVTREDHWPSAMAQTLRVPRATFRSRDHRSLKQWTEVPIGCPAGQFEQVVDCDHPAPVAVWTDGFTSAAEQLPQMVRWLDGDREAL